MSFKPIIKGALTFIPGIQRLTPRRGTGGTTSADYCYGVWLKHLTYLHQNGMTAIPHTLAELGPGDSLGIGLAAMLTGVDRYFALDVVAHSNPDRNVAIFDQLVELFRKMAPRPTKGWPDFDHLLDASLFPSQLLTAERLDQALHPDRVAAIRAALTHLGQSHDGICIEYKVPWDSAEVVQANSVDLVLSHSVLEHVEDLPKTYAALHRWLRPGGIMSHQADFTSHGHSAEWNGFRAYSELTWRVIRGNRPYLINRQPCTYHLDLIDKIDFELFDDQHQLRNDGIGRSQLAARWRDLSDHDIACASLFVQARKKV